MMLFLSSCPSTDTMPPDPQIDFYKRLPRYIPQKGGKDNILSNKEIPRHQIYDLQAASEELDELLSRH